MLILSKFGHASAACGDGRTHGKRYAGERIIHLEPLEGRCLFSYAPAAPVSWENTGPGGGGRITSLLVSDNNANQLFVGGDVSGFFVSSNQGASYTIANGQYGEDPNAGQGLADRFIHAMVQSPTHPASIYVGTHGGVFYTPDTGTTWHDISGNLPGIYSGRKVGTLMMSQDGSLYIGLLAASSTTPGAVYKLDSSQVSNLENNSNYTVSWSRCNTGAHNGGLPNGINITKIIQDPRSGSANTFYLACQDDVFRSTDGGLNWTVFNTGLPQDKNNSGTLLNYTTATGGTAPAYFAQDIAVALAPNGNPVLYVTIHSPAISSSWQGGVYQCMDGVNWNAFNNGLSQRASATYPADYLNLVVNPNNYQEIYVGGDSVAGDIAGVWYYSGASWHQGSYARGWTNWGPTAWCLTQGGDGTLYSGTWDGIYKSIDSGRTWTQAFSSSTNSANITTTGLENTVSFGTFVDPRDTTGNTIYFAYADLALVKTTDGGQTFSWCKNGVPTTNNLNNSCYSMVFNANYMIASFGSHTANYGVVVRWNGSQWSSVSNGLPGGIITQLIAAPVSGYYNRVLAAVQNGGIYVCDDITTGTPSWTLWGQSLSGQNCRAIVADPTNTGLASDRYWCATLTNVYVRTNGSDWQQMSTSGFPTLTGSDNKIQSIAIAPSDHTRLYVMVRADYSSTARGLFLSDDATSLSAGWRKIYNDDGVVNGNSDYDYPSGLAVDPYDVNTVYLGLKDDPYHGDATGGGVLVTHNATAGTVTWNSLNGSGTGSLQNMSVTCIAINPFNTGCIYAGTQGNGVFKGIVNLVNNNLENKAVIIDNGADYIATPALRMATLVCRSEDHSVIDGPTLMGAGTALDSSILQTIPQIHSLPPNTSISQPFKFTSSDTCSFLWYAKRRLSYAAHIMQVFSDGAMVSISKPATSLWVISEMDSYRWHWFRCSSVSSAAERSSAPALP